MLFLLQPSKVLRWVDLLKHTELSYLDIRYSIILKHFESFGISCGRLIISQCHTTPYDALVIVS